MPGNCLTLITINIIAIKVLIAVSSKGSIAYIFAAWGGRVSDKVILNPAVWISEIY